MAIRLTTTRESAGFVKVLVYGESGVGKTWLIKTAPNPVIISAEKGLLTLKDQNIPVIEISSLADLEDAYEFVTTNPKCKKFLTVCLDSISDIGETILAHEKTICGADPRQAYGAYVDKLLPLIKKFRDIEDKHVYFTAKLRAVKDGFTEITSYGPSMPGQQLGPALPYQFDFCIPLRIGQDEDGVKFRYLQTEADIQFTAKARGDNLSPVEAPDLTQLFEKVLSDEVLEDETEEQEEKKAIEVEGSFETEPETEIDQVASDEEDAANQDAAEGNAEDPGDEESMDEAAESSFEVEEDIPA